MSEWQPIETAPKNTPILVAPSHIQGRSCDMAWMPSTHCRWMEVDEFGEKNLKPTHWMPLPEPPARPAPKGKAPSIPLGKDMTKEEILEAMEEKKNDKD